MRKKCETLKKTSIFRFFTKKYWRLKGIPRHPIQNTPTSDGYNIIYLGTEYGGWSFVDEDDLNNCTIISAGLGEDASFDVEFASKYNAKVIIIDPTPRAISHFNEIINSLGNLPNMEYVEGGCQPIDAYDLSAITKDKFLLVTKALWNENTSLKFFEPTDPRSVSHSIINYKNNYSDNTKSIEVETITLESLCAEFDINGSDIPLLKLDIEGAEIEVIKKCIEIGITPRQILVSLTS